MIAVEDTAPERPAARAKGTVSPSAIPMTMSRTTAEAEKCLSICGVVGMRHQMSSAGHGSVKLVQAPGAAAEGLDTARQHSQQDAVLPKIMAARRHVRLVRRKTVTVGKGAQSSAGVLGHGWVGSADPK